MSVSGGALSFHVRCQRATAHSSRPRTGQRPSVIGLDSVVGCQLEGYTTHGSRHFRFPARVSPPLMPWTANELKHVLTQSRVISTTVSGSLLARHVEKRGTQHIVPRQPGIMAVCSITRCALTDLVPHGRLLECCWDQRLHGVSIGVQLHNISLAPRRRLTTARYAICMAVSSWWMRSGTVRSLTARIQPLDDIAGNMH